MEHNNATAAASATNFRPLTAATALAAAAAAAAGTATATRNSSDQQLPHKQQDITMQQQQQQQHQPQQQQQHQQQQQQQQPQQAAHNQQHQSQQQQQHQQQQQQHQQQAQQQHPTGSEHQQQFCLRWHNHQTSLLSTLPILLDQSHLTDVTISAEGRTLRAHRVVLSACSSFFLEIFRTLDTTHHPVIIIPGASFQAIVSLLTFMYSGEVNVYEEQIPTLLSLAETLGIKGLADVHNNLQKSHKPSSLDKDLEEREKSLTPPTPPPSSCSQTTSGNFTMPPTPVLAPSLPNVLPTSPFSPLLNPVLNSKFPSPLENFFLKSLQFYPNLMHQPLNFSQTALNKTSELLAKYQQQCNLYQANLAMNNKDLMPLLHADEVANRPLFTDDVLGAKRFCAGLDKKSASASSCANAQLSASSALTLPPAPKDVKRIDKIVENLRGSCSAGQAGNAKLPSNHDSASNSSLSTQLSPLAAKSPMDSYTAASSTTAASFMPAKSSLAQPPTSPLHPQLGFNISAEDQLKLQQHLDKYAASCAAAAAAASSSSAEHQELSKQEARSASGDKVAPTTPQSPQGKAPSSSKLYATCFICNKQLSNQYNLRVHLETHQNVRYACNVCSHVSRSKDALRKHVSYRHPGAPSPCETEARRKRANKLLASSINASAAALAAASASSGETTPTSPSTPAAMQSPFQTGSAAATSMENERASGGGDASIVNSPQAQLTAAQLNSAYQMFLPNQFHLAAAAAAQQHLSESLQSPTPTPAKEFGMPAIVPNNMSAAGSPPAVEMAKPGSENVSSSNSTNSTTNTTTNSPTLLTTTTTMANASSSNSNPADSPSHATADATAANSLHTAAEMRMSSPPSTITNP